MKKEMDADAVLVGVDDGYRETKLAWRDKKGGLKTFKVPSSVRIGALGVSSFDGKVSGYETEGITYSVGDFTDGEDTRFPGYAVSPIVRVLVHHALIGAGFEGKKVSIATGLPPRDAYLPSGERNIGLIAQKKERMAVPVSRRDGGKLAAIVGHEVYTQGIGALVDYLSVKNEEIPGPVGVVDVGGQTTDVAVIVPGPEGMAVDLRRSGSESVGVLDVLDEISRLIRVQEHLDDRLPVSALERALSSGEMMLWGKKKDVTAIVNQAKSEIAERIRRFVTGKIGRGVDLSFVLFSGGGAKVLDGIFSYPHLVESEDPQFANARGFLYYLELVNGAGE